MKYAFYIISLTVAAGLIAGYFCWYQWRPSQIKKECTKVVKEKNKDMDWSGYKVSELINARDMWYNNCLHEKGL